MRAQTILVLFLCLLGACAEPDETCVPTYVDSDGDGWGDAESSECAVAEGLSERTGDCDDSVAEVFPGAPEADCTDPVDYNCDGTVGFADADGDGFAACKDCNDGRALIWPGAPELCDGEDNDCDGAIDEQATDATPWYRDLDGDGIGDGQAVDACTSPDGYSSTNGDCDDLDATSAPGLDERCDGVDNNCDGAVDEEPTVDGLTWYADADGDGFGDTDQSARACQAPPGFVANDTDCNDGRALIWPGAPEVCDGLDNNCDLAIDELPASGSQVWYADDDGDLYGDPSDWVEACAQPAGYIAENTDCNDNRQLVNPGATEFCNGLDNDCNGLVDDGAADALSWFLDIDGDGFGDPSAPVAACAPSSVLVADDTDCDDYDASRFPAAIEVCDPGDVDEDCDGLSDELDPSLDPSSLLDFWADLDGDGFGLSLVLACEMPANAANVNGDCDDGDPSIYPGQTESCDAVDHDCSGDPWDAIGGPSWFADVDADGFGDDNAAVTACLQPSGYTPIGGDCDDQDDQVHPAATEICDNGLDDDCDGVGLVNAECAPTGPTTLGDGDETLTGIALGSGDQGAALAAVDFNGDGIDDLVVGDPELATVRVYFGPLSSGGIDTADVVISGSLNVDFGLAIAGLDDFDGDGIDDFAVGVPGGGAVAAGQVMIFAGSLSPSPIVADSSAILTLEGGATGDRLGASLDGGADVNGDGLGDLLVGAEEQGPLDGGAVYLVHGGTTSPAIADAELRWTAENPGDKTGCSVAFAGDVDGDGSQDVLIGARQSDAAATWGGQAYLSYGPLPSGTLDLAFADVRFVGDSEDDQAGCAVTGPGDLNFDGYDDVLISSCERWPGGAVGVFFGPVAPATHAIDTAHSLFVGESSGDEFGAVVSSGDIDGDGSVDLVIGAPGHGWYSSGRTHVFYGRTWSPVYDSRYADALIDGEDAERVPDALVADGDFNGDGYDDFAIGGIDIGVNNEGSVSVFNGGPGRGDLFDDADGDGWTEADGDCDDTRASVNPDQFEICNDGLDNDCLGGDADCAPVGAIELAVGGDKPYSVESAGDFNGDGIGDLIYGYIGGEGDAGLVCVVYGPVSEGPFDFAMADFCLDGEVADDHAGATVTGIGDFNGDGFDDIAIGAPELDDFSTKNGRAYVVFGAPVQVETSLAGADLIFKPDDLGIRNTFAGLSITGVGDINDDGIDDLLIGSYERVGYGSGAAFLFYGGMPTGEYQLSDADVVIEGGAAGPLLGYDLASAGDVNGDGYTDVLIGGRDHAGEDGAAFLFDGPLQPTVHTFDARARFLGLEWGRVAAAGDVNGDGYDDVLTIAAAFSDTYVSAGLWLGPIQGEDKYPLDADVLFFEDDVNEDILPILDGGDIDGDGYSDVMIGFEDFFGDGVWIFYGPLQTGSSFDLVTQADARIHGDNLNLGGKQGAAIVGDLNDDGYADIFVGRDIVHGGVRLSDSHTPTEIDPTADLDGDGYSILDGDCDDNRSDLAPGLFDQCEDGIDADCDGRDTWCAPAGEVYLSDEASIMLQGYPISATVIAADFNGDGFGDIGFGSYQAYVFGANSGAILVSEGPLRPDPLAPGERRLAYGDSGSKLGDDIALGDTDGDGRPDVLATNSRDEALLFVAAAPGVASTVYVDLNSFTGDAAWLGDIQGNGRDSAILGARFDDLAYTDAGSVFLFADTPGAVESATVAMATLTGESASDRVGGAITSLDVDGDGLEDVIVGSRYHDGYKGRAYVNLAPHAGVIDLGTSDGIIDSTYWGEFGGSVTDMGDLDGDGLDDFAVGAPSADGYVVSSGVVYVYTQMPGPAALSSDADFTFFGGNYGEKFGTGVANVGDLNGDGADDVAIGAIEYATVPVDDNGAVYLFYGPFASQTFPFDAGAFLIGEVNSDVGDVIAGVGDVNVDGYGDMVVSASLDGEVFVLFGGPLP